MLGPGPPVGGGGGGGAPPGGGVGPVDGPDPDRAEPPVLLGTQSPLALTVPVWPPAAPRGIVVEPPDEPVPVDEDPPEPAGAPAAGAVQLPFRSSTVLYSFALASTASASVRWPAALSSAARRAAVITG